MKLELKGLKNSLISKNFPNKLGQFIIEREAYVLMLIFIIFLCYCAYLWYGYVYDYRWDDIKKQEYINNKKSNTDFDKEVFEKVLEDMIYRQSEYQKNIEGHKDIFRLK